MPLLLVLMVGMAFHSCTGTDTGNPLVRQDGPQTLVAGTYTDSLGQPVPNCTLWIRSIPQAYSVSALTKVRVEIDSPFVDQAIYIGTEGDFEISGLPEGHYVFMAYTRRLGLGHQLRISISEGDTVQLTEEELEMEPLFDLQVILDTTWESGSIHILELGLSRNYNGDTLTVEDVPQGIYTVVSGQDSTQWIRVSNSLIDSVGLNSFGIRDTTDTLPGLPPFADTTHSRSDTLNSTDTVESIPDTVYAKDSSLVAQDSNGRLYYVDPRTGFDYTVISVLNHYWYAQNAASPVSNASCNPSDSSADCRTYGRYYNFLQAKDSVCVYPWRLSTQQDWSALIFMAGSDVAGYLLKSTTGWNSDGNGIDRYGFNGLPAGSTYSMSLGGSANFWTSDTNDQGRVYSYQMSASSPFADLIDVGPSEGFSVRCVLDQE